jgi:hypothetical protein
LIFLTAGPPAEAQLHRAIPKADPNLRLTGEGSFTLNLAILEHDPRRQRRGQRSRGCVDDHLDISVIAAMQAGYIGGSALFVTVAD